MSGLASFHYDGVAIDVGRATVSCHYSIGDQRFEETLRIPEGDLGAPGVAQAATLYFLFAGVSYLKTSMPLLVDLGATATSRAEREVLTSFFIDGLGEFALRNSLDLRGLELTGPVAEPAPVALEVDLGRLLIPFGGGLDSIVTVAELAPLADDAALFVVERPGARFDAIERPAALTGLEVVRAERAIDEKVLHSTKHGYLNGHVPVTGIISAIAVLSALATGRGAVAMSNERSASSATTEGPGGPVNHQWSKGIDFERGFRSLLAARLPGVEYFSWLRDRSELSIAERFAGLESYHLAFRSCNRAFHQDPARRAARWCGICDKCLFIDLVLAPQLSRERLNEIFDGVEPLENPALVDQLAVLVGSSQATRPFECVGDVDECRQALLTLANRDDRRSNETVQRLASSLTDVITPAEPPPCGLIPERYAARARLV